MVPTKNHIRVRLGPTIAMTPFLLGGCSRLGLASDPLLILVSAVFLGGIAGLFVFTLMRRTGLGVDRLNRDLSNAQAEVNACSKRYNALFTSSQDGVAILKNGVFLDINPMLVDFFGIPREEILGKDPFVFSPTEQPDGKNSRAQGYAYILAALRGKTQRFTWRHIRGDGTTLDSTTILDRVEMEGEYNLQMILRDISEPKRIQEELGELNAILQSVLDQAPFGVMVALGQQGDWRMIICNAEVLRLTGMGPEVAASYRVKQGSPLESAHGGFSFFNSEGKRLLPAQLPMARLMDKGETITNERMTLTRADGSNFLLNMNTAFIPAPDAGFCGGVAIFQDITDRTLAENFLVSAKKDAEQANLTKNEFLANMSHELRTPLNAVLGMLQLLKRTEDPQERIEFVDIALKSGRSLLTILSDILDLAMIESGDFVIRDEGVNIPDLLLTVVESFELQASAKPLSIDYSVDESVLDWIVCDASRVRQILFNLVGNAVKFTEHGKVHIAVTLLRPPQKNGAHRLLFTVEDSGIGIQNDKLACIFEPFIQADGSMTRAHGGTGLGL
ncbi:MAG: PAS domain S-box protein, partial [Proteobacteria bacterium]|nr:PAS domain S-box protein [Pseudomonadota bacterium]MBU1612046.1 PAS domain S-box protein [Pseudomonadota bacterium]